MKRLAYLMACVVAFVCVIAPVNGLTAPPTIDEILTTLDLGPDAKSDLLAGKIISKEWNELSARELALGMAVYLPRPPEAVVEYVQQTKWLASDPSISAFGELPRGAGTEAFAPLGYTAGQNNDVDKLAAGNPGESFNLDAGEWATFKSALAQASGSELLAKASDTWRSVLLKRFQDYLTGGLPAIRPYDRGDGESTNAGQGLAAAAADTPLLKRYFPEFQALLVGYPQGLTPDVTDRLFWIVSKVENRPCFVLSHFLSKKSGGAVVLAHRQYYVSHSYNSLQIIAGLLPAEGGSFVFYLNRTSTDQVDGFPEAVRHNMGRGQMKEAITTVFERLRTQLGGS